MAPGSWEKRVSSRQAGLHAMHTLRRGPLLLVATCLVWLTIAGLASAARADGVTPSAPASPPASSAPPAGADTQLLGSSFDNWESSSFTWSLGHEIGWDDERWDFVASKGVARYGKTFLFRHYGENRTIQAIPYKFPLPPDSGKPPQRDGNLIKVLGPSDYDKFLGVCEIGTPRPDIWAFYTKKGDDTRLYWRQHTQQYNVEHSFVWPSQQLVINGQLMTPKMLFRVDTANWDRFIGRVVAFNGGLAFVGRTAYWDSMEYVVTIDPNAPQQAKIWSRSYTWADSGGHPSAVDACSVSHDGKELLVVGTLTGKEADCPDRWKPFSRWTESKGYVDYFDANCTNTLHKELPIWSVNDWDRKYVSAYGPRAIQLIQGGLDGSSPMNSPDNLQIFIQDGGTNGNPYPFNGEVLTEIEWSLTANNLSGRWEHFANTTRYSAGGNIGYQEVNFMVFPVLANRPDLKNGDYVGLSQYIYVASAHVSTGGSDPFGFVTAFQSDTLVPVKNEEANGQAFKYPYNLEMSEDPATWDLLGVVYGPPPFSLQGYDFSELKNLNKWMGSRFSFKNATGEKSKLTIKAGGSVSLSEEFFGIGCSATFGLDYATAKETSTDSDCEFSFKHDEKDEADYGYFICNKPHYEVQPYTRKTWWGENIPNSRIYVTNCTDKEGDSTLTFYPFNMTTPDKEAVSKGLRAHARPSDFTSRDWTKDPMTGAGDNWKKISQALLTADTRGGETTTSITKGQEKSTSWEVTTKHKAKYAFLKAEFHFGVATDSTLSNAKNTTCYLGLDAPKEGSKSPTLARRLEVEAYWLQADTSNCYWVPEAFRTNGNSQKPWCIDYRVRAWEPYRSGAGEGSGSCAVAVVAGPSEGGSVSIAPVGGPAAGESSLDLPIGQQAVIAATPADGYEFAGWTAEGDQLQIAAPQTLQTTVGVGDGGGATAVAVFRRVVPGITVARRSAGVCDISVRNADLPAAIGQAGGEPQDMELGLQVGDDWYVCPADSWVSGGTNYTSSFRPDGWKSGAKLTLQIDRRRGTWSLHATGVRRAGDFLLDCAAGRATLALTAKGQAVGLDSVPVAARATIAQASTPRSRTSTASGETAPGTRAKVRTARPAVDLSRARVAVSTLGGPARTTFVLSGARVSTRLLNARGFDLYLNGRDILVGPFKLSGGLRTYHGTNVGGARVACAYSPSGRLSLKISGRSALPMLDTLIGNNISLRVIRGSVSAEGNMIAGVRALSGLRAVR